MPSKLRQFIDGEDMSVILHQEEDLGPRILTAKSRL